MDESQILGRLAAIENNVNNNTAAIMALTAALASLPETSTINSHKAHQVLSGLLSGQTALAQLEAPARVILENLLTNAQEASRH